MNTSAKADPVRWEIQDGIALLEMRELSTANGLSVAMVEGLVRGLSALAEAPEARVVVLSGTTEIFSSGATPEMLRAIAERRLRPTELTLARTLLGHPLPIIAAAEGHAIGGGFALALAADFQILALESRYGLNFMELGITPGMGTTRLLDGVISRSIANELLYTGALRRGRELVGLGFNAIVPRAEVRARAMDLAWDLAGKPRANLELLKRTLTLSRRKDFEEAISIESMMHEQSFARLVLEEK